MSVNGLLVLVLIKYIQLHISQACYQSPDGQDKMQQFACFFITSENWCVAGEIKGVDILRTPIAADN